MTRKSIYFGALLEQRLSRRGFLAASGAAAATGALPALGAGADTTHSATVKSYTALAPSLEDALRLSPGLRSQVVVGFGDPLFEGDPGLTTRDLRTLDWLDRDAATRQERRFGTNNDALAFFPMRGRRDAGLLCANHEYVDELVFAGLSGSDSDQARQVAAMIAARPQIVAWMQAAHGVSVLEVRRGMRGWQVVRGAPATRRITANTPMEISGPARGAALLRTSADPTGTRVLGTFANCAGGKTPWGTYLTAEENIQDYFGGARTWAGGADADEATKRAHRRWPLREGSAYGWDTVDPRFDVRREPREALRHGWIVEIDPQEPTMAPRKRTALGRFCHEGANTILTKDGRVAAYMGDDTKFEYVYKFVSRDRFDPKDRAANRDLLDHGTLHVARFDADGRGEWLPLVYDERGPLNSEAGFTSQAEVVIRCREAADLLGATPMDRPEDVEPSPVTGRVYMALTKNDSRAPERRDFMGRNIDLGPNAANPRPKNDFGHIVELIEDGDDAASSRFAWNVFLLAGDPRNGAARFLTRAEDLTAGPLAREDVYYAGYADRGAVSPIACPDNLGFDPSGRLWVVTDADTKLIGNNGCFVVPTSGPDRGRLTQVLSAPVGAEVCGCEFTPDGKTLFLSIQHPGEGGTVDAPASHWPDGGGLPARSAVIAVSREDGAPL